MAENTSNHDLDLLSRFVAREISEREVSSALFDKYYPLLSFAASKYGVPEAERETAASEALSIAVRFLVTHHAPRSFHAVMMIGFRRRVNDARRRAGLPPYVPVDKSGVPETDTALVRAVLDGLMSEDEAQLMLLRYVEGATDEAIAVARNEPLETIAMRAARADALFDRVIAETSAAEA